MMAEFREDRDFYPLMVKLSGCLEVELEKSGLPGLCKNTVLPGAVAMIDCMCDGEEECDGQGWVLATRVFPSTSFPEEDATATCVTALAVELQLGVSRCVPAFSDDDGTPPTVEMSVAATRLQMADMAAMRRAISCCMAEIDTDYVLSGYQSITSEGNCGGGAWTLLIHQAF